jgi:hypothetical protein
MKTLNEAMYEAVSAMEVGEAIAQLKAEYPGLTEDQYRAAIESTISLLQDEQREIEANIEAYRHLELELCEAMKRGAVVFVNKSTGETKILAHDDLPFDVRECIRISRKSTQMFAGRASYIPTTPDELAFQEEERQHHATCPSCMESAAEYHLMDAAWWRDEADRDPAPYPDGTRRTPEQCAAELEAEAAELRAEAAKIRAARLTERT